MIPTKTPFNTIFGNAFAVNPMPNGSPLLPGSGSPGTTSTQPIASRSFTVTNINDSGAGSFRQAISDANQDGLNNPGINHFIRFSLNTTTPQTITLKSTLDIIDKKLTIDAFGANLTVSGNNQVQDFIIESSANVTLIGLTISQGRTLNGGGILNYGTLNLINDTLSNNTATEFAGGGVFNVGTLTIADSIFTNNYGGLGGGIANFAKMSISGSSFINNTAIQGGAFGAFINTTTNASGLVFSGNKATKATQTSTDNNNFVGDINFTNITVDSLSDTTGGFLSQGKVSLRDAIAALGSGGTINFSTKLPNNTLILTQGELSITKDLTLTGLGADKLIISGDRKFRDFSIASNTNVSISGLTITNGVTDGDGAGILNYGSLKLSNVIISNNQNIKYGTGGGIANKLGAALTITNSTIYNNANEVAGGGIINQGSLDLVNTTISRNRSLYGGGIWNNGNLTMNHTTIAFNFAAYGGGIRNLDGIVKVHNTIVARNNGSQGTDIMGDFITQGFNLIGVQDSDATGFTNNLNGDLVGTLAAPIDVKLLSLQSNGGKTYTNALLPGSLAINAADPNETLTTDQRGIARIQRGRADIGAYELV